MPTLQIWSFLAGSFGIVGAVVFGSLAAALGAWFLPGRTGRTLPLALLGPVLANAVIVSAYLPILLQGLGDSTHSIFTTIEFDVDLRILLCSCLFLSPQDSGCCCSVLRCWLSCA